MLTIDTTRQAYALITQAIKAADRITEDGEAEGWIDHAAALADWLTDGTHPGGALQALIDGDMWRFAHVSSVDTWRHARSIMQALYSHAPRHAIGRPGTYTIDGAMADWRHIIEEARELLAQAEDDRRHRDEADPAEVARREHAEDAAAGIEWPRP